MPDQPQRVSKNIRSEGYREIYSNNCNMRTSNFDFVFEFGKITGMTDKEVESLSEVSVYMSPQQAKILLKVFANNVEQYEKNFGTIVYEAIPQKPPTK